MALPKLSLELRWSRPNRRKLDWRALEIVDKDSGPFAPGSGGTGERLGSVQSVQLRRLAVDKAAVTSHLPEPVCLMNEILVSSHGASLP
jgi:hypothetical protein